MNKSEKYVAFGQDGKISVQLDNEHYENGKTLNSEKFMIIFAKI